MRQLCTIIYRELKVKFRLRSFYIFALVTPLLFLLPIIFSMFSVPKSSTLIDRNWVGIICRSYPYDTLEFRGIKFFKLSKQQTEKLRSGSFDFDSYIGVIDMGDRSFSSEFYGEPVKFYIDESGADFASPYIKDIESYANSEFVYQFGEKKGVSAEDLSKISNFIKISTVICQNKMGVQKQTAAKIIAYVLGMLLYIMFILYNNNIIRSVSEEKHNKLAEVLSMFVRPSHLMLGKIIGLGLASLMQLIIWIAAFYFYFKLVLELCGSQEYMATGDIISTAIAGLSSLSINYIITWLIAFFILGFLLNGTLSTIIAICSSNNNSAIAMVLGNMINLLGIYFGMYAATYPDAVLTKFASYFPLFSFIVTPILIPYGIPMSQIILSIVILLITIFVLLKMTGKLYQRSLSK